MEFLRLHHLFYPVLGTLVHGVRWPLGVLNDRGLLFHFSAWRNIFPWSEK